MKRPKFPNVCPERIRDEGGTLALMPYGKDQEHEPLMVQAPQPDLGDGMLTPIVESEWVQFRQVFEDDNGGEFKILSVICKYCGQLYTVTEDV